MSNPSQVCCTVSDKVVIKKKNKNVFTSYYNNRTTLLNIRMYLFCTKHGDISFSPLPHEATTLELPIYQNTWQQS